MTIASGVFILQVIQPVKIPLLVQLLIAPITYGVVPEAAIPITLSLVLILNFNKSFQPCLVSSSANS